MLLIVLVMGQHQITPLRRVKLFVKKDQCAQKKAGVPPLGAISLSQINSRHFHYLDLQSSPGWGGVVNPLALPVEGRHEFFDLLAWALWAQAQVGLP